MARTTVTNEQRRELGRRGLRTLITRKMDPTGELERTDPAEFARQYELAKRAHMAAMQAAHHAKAAEWNAAKTAPVVVAMPFLWTVCPQCNQEGGITLPPDVAAALPSQVCVKHYLCGKPWYPLGAHEWSIRKPWLVDGTVKAKAQRA